MEQLQGMDASFVAMEQRNSPMHIGSLLIYDPSTAPGGFVRFKDILAFYESRMQLSKTMRQRLVRVPMGIDYPYWMEDPDFDLEYHVRHVALPKPGDWRQLCIQTARIFSRPLDLNRPPWEFTVIEGLDNIPGIPAGCFGVVTKVHHAAIDGMSGIDLMEALHTLFPDAPPPTTPDNWQPDPPPNPVALFLKGYANAWLNPLRQMDVARKAMPGLFRAGRGIANRDFDIDPAVNTPRTRFNVKLSPNRVVEGRAFELDQIKALRALSHGAKINDVFLTIIGGALRQYLLSKDDLPPETLTAMAPISVRSEGEKNSMGNQVSAMLVPLGSHIADPVERLRYVHAQTVKSKTMTEALGARQMTEMSKVAPALFLALGARLYTSLGIADVMKPVINTVVTNVPGPPVPIYSAGAKLLHMQGLLCLTDGMALGHVVQSYCTQATVSFTADRKVMPDPEFYAQCLQDSFDSLIDALKKAPAEKPKAAAKTTAKAAAKPKVAAKPKARTAPKPKAATPRRKPPERGADAAPAAGSA